MSHVSLFSDFNLKLTKCSRHRTIHTFAFIILCVNSKLFNFSVNRTQGSIFQFYLQPRAFLNKTRKVFPICHTSWPVESGKSN